MLLLPLSSRPSAVFPPINTSSTPRNHRPPRRHSRSRAVVPPSLHSSRGGSRSAPLSPSPTSPPKKWVRPPLPPLQQEEDHVAEARRKNADLKKLLRELSKKGGSPLAVLERDGDWDAERFWVVARFLKETGTTKGMMEVFDAWTDRDKSRVNGVNHSQLICLLCEKGSMEEAITVLRKMETHGFAPDVLIYNSLVAGFASNGDFKSANEIVKQMVELGLTPENETYNGLIRGYGMHKMYDEMSKCAKKMQLEGCAPDEVTYNLLISEYARGKLLWKMEEACMTLMSRKMPLLPSSLVVMIEAYADLGLLENMQKLYRRVLNGHGHLKESLVRKVARVYIENHRFAQLEEFATEIDSKIGRTQLFWCLMLLASAGLRSRKGMASVIREMENENMRMTATHINILAHAFSTMNDFRSLDILLLSLRQWNLKPDIVTVGVLFDACSIGFDGTRALEAWSRYGFLDYMAQMDTDPLVLAAYGKGCFLRRCEELYSSNGPNFKERTEWKYSDLINLVFKPRQCKGGK